MRSSQKTGLLIRPDFGDFCKLAKAGNLIPVYSESLADLETPVSVFLRLRDAEAFFLLESVEEGRSQGRYSFIGLAPDAVLASRDGRVTLRKKGDRSPVTVSGDPLAALQKELGVYRYVAHGDLPRFCGGAVGYLGYEMGPCFDKVPLAGGVSEWPEMYFGLTSRMVVIDHLMRKMKIVVNCFLDLEDRGGSTLKKRYEDAVRQIAGIQRLLDLPPAQAQSACTAAPLKSNGASQTKSNFSLKSFKRAVLRAKEHIRNGDAIQIVLSQRFRRKVSVSAFDIYRHLRMINPSPYLFYLRCGELEIVGSSPEMHVRLEDGRVELRPIAGTRPRGESPSEDRALEAELLNDIKERAEHVMLVDLGRNDLGRVCKTGSVRVSEFMKVERYSHVMHLVSRVEGSLAKGRSVYDVIRATFPAGTVTGAPKVRAMEIIADLERKRRGPYAGLVGYLSYSGNFDSCITIRTLWKEGDQIHAQAGAGVVADSDPAKEYQETLSKSKAIFKAIESAERSRAVQTTPSGARRCF